MKIINEDRKKKKNKFAFGWFTTLNPGDPEKNKEIFNKNTTYNFPSTDTTVEGESSEASGESASSGDVGAAASGGMGESLDEAQTSQQTSENRRLKTALRKESPAEDEGENKPNFKNYSVHHRDDTIDPITHLKSSARDNLIFIPRLSQSDRKPRDGLHQLITTWAHCSDAPENFDDFVDELKNKDIWYYTDTGRAKAPLGKLTKSFFIQGDINKWI